jgi:PAS domain S-box-containing protein
MLAEFLQDRAALYVSGAMSAAERENFELILEFHQDLRAHVTGLQEAMAAVYMARVPAKAAPPRALKARLLESLGALPGQPGPEGLVVTGPDALVEWVNPAFTAMCGYALGELRGRKPGQLLQGPDTDPAAVGRIRGALRDRRVCRESLVNYHKDGTRYRVDVRITPILDDAGQPLWFVAQERQLPDHAALAGCP